MHTNMLDQSSLDASVGWHRDDVVHHCCCRVWHKCCWVSGDLHRSIQWNNKVLVQDEPALAPTQNQHLICAGGLCATHRSQLDAVRLEILPSVSEVPLWVSHGPQKICFHFTSFQKVGWEDGRKRATSDEQDLELSEKDSRSREEEEEE